MIYILSGNDLKNKGIYIKEITKNHEVFFIENNIITKEFVLNYALGVSLFGEYPILIIESILKNEDIIFSNDDLQELKESKTIFIFKEDKLLAVDQKKFTKYAELKVFDSKQINKIEKFNIFSITDAFANKNKILTWTLYIKGIEKGVEPEAIAGVIFWKIKTMILNSSKSFNKIELKKQLSQIVSIYHKAHRGELDFVVGIEQFILSTLSSK